MSPQTQPTLVTSDTRPTPATRASRAAPRLLATVALAVTLAACGGSDDDEPVVGITVVPTPTRTPLPLPTAVVAGDEAVEVAAVQVLTTMAAIVANAPGIPAGSGGSAGDGSAGRAAQGATLAGATIRFARRAAATDADAGGAAQAGTPCPFGGTIAATCRESGGTTLIQAHLDDCTLLDEETGLLVRSQGVLELTLPRRGVCNSGQVPPDVVVTARAPVLVQTLIESARTLVSTRFDDVTQVIEPLGQGCAGPERRSTVTGSVAVDFSQTGQSLRLEIERLALETRSGGSPCVRSQLASGAFVLDAHGFESIQHLESMRLVYPSEDDPSLLEIEGRMTTACAGHDRLPHQRAARLWARSALPGGRRPRARGRGAARARAPVARRRARPRLRRRRPGRRLVPELRARARSLPGRVVNEDEVSARPISGALRGRARAMAATTTLRGAAAALVALLFAACSTDQSGAVMPGVRLTDLRRVLVECRPQDDAGVCDLLARDLRARGWAVEAAGAGEAGRAQADVVVTYEDRWMWDVSMYLLTLRVDVRDPRTNVLLATAHVYRTSLARSTPEEMVRRAVEALFAAQR